MPRRKSDQNSGIIPQHPAVIGVGIRLRRIREARRLKLRAFARTLGVSPQALSLWERGQRLPPLSTVAFMLGKLGVDHTTAQRIIDQASQGELPDLVDTNHQDHAATGWRYEHLADHITIWAPTLVPELLRTPEYDVSLLTDVLANTDLGDAYALAVPQRRADLADRQRRYTFVLGDTALRACPAPLRHHQLEHLRWRARQPNVTITVVPADKCPAGLIAPFTLYKKDKSTIAAAIDHHHASTYITDRDALNRYHRTVTRLHTLGKNTISDDDSREATTQSGILSRTSAQAAVTAELRPHPPVEPAPSPDTSHDGIAGTDTYEPHAAPSRTQVKEVSASTSGELILGSRVAELRAARGLARSRLAAAIDVPVSRIVSLEHGAAILSSLADIAALADVLEVPRAEFAQAALHDLQVRYNLPPRKLQPSATSSIEASDTWLIGNWVRAERENRGLTINNLTCLSGIPQDTLVQLESNAVTVSLLLVVQLADALHVPRQALVMAAMSSLPRRPPRGHDPRTSQ
ncbi:Scr1 family TA system antitoxin-like transcriptional regulator [Amycolatopsis sp. cmx-4-68]|uniref:Scr1 family TA system antitoxin-like transcriptional regulator n=1 Tax=Amycolatopsis sp. cmx-4-68 TaxID=2790938 RepID=UPI00397BEFC3